MAVRYAKIEYSDVIAFFEAWENQFKKGAVYLTPGMIEGEPAPEIKVDLVVGSLGRVGPIPAQVIHRAPDGGVGLQIPEIPAAADSQIKAFDKFFDRMKDFLVKRGDVIPADRVEEMIKQAVAAAVEAAVAEALANAPAAPVAAPVGDGAPAIDGAPAPGGGAPAAAGPVGGLKLPDLRGVPPTSSGSLGDKSLRNALIDATIKRSDGLLTLKLKSGVTRYGFWNKGGPVGWRAEPLQQDEVMGVLLYRAGQVTKEQLQKSIEIMEKQDCRQGEAFIEMGLMSFAQLVMVLQKQCEYIFLRVIDETEGEWTFHELQTLPERFFNPALKASNVIYRQLTHEIEQMTTNVIYDKLRPQLDRYLFVRDNVGDAMNEISWSKDERRFLELIQSRSWRLREIFAVSNMSRRATARFLWALLDLDFLAFKEQENLERYMKRITELIMTKHHRSERSNLFDILEVHWICTAPEVESGYKAVKERFQQKNFDHLTEEHKQALVSINQKLDDAYQRLRDDARRRAYREEIIEKDMIVNSAELLAKKGEMAIMRADGRDARFCWGKAVELVPGRGEFREGYQRARAIPLGPG
jgi:hypothetical protein